MCIYIYIHTHVCIHICYSVYIHRYIYIHIYVILYICTYIYMLFCVYTYIYITVYISIHILCITKAFEILNIDGQCLQKRENSGFCVALFPPSK